MSQTPVISVIIPTLATERRAPLLQRALASLDSQSGVAIQAIVVLNGPQVSPSVRDALRQRPEVRVTELAEADLPAALRLGRELVESAYFAELDDDDELLPGALSRRLAALVETPSADLVVTDGIWRSNGGDVPFIPDMARVRADPLRALLRRNWLAPGAALFRTERVGAEVFDEIPRCLEWTALGLRLALDRRILFLDEPTFIHYVDHAFSITNSKDYALGLPAALCSLLELPLPDDLQQTILGKLTAANHAASVCALANDCIIDAWKLHLRSMAGQGGLRYWSYTAKLLAGSLRPNGAAAP